MAGMSGKAREFWRDTRHFHVLQNFWSTKQKKGVCVVGGRKEKEISGGEINLWEQVNLEIFWLDFTRKQIIPYACGTF